MSVDMLPNTTNQSRVNPLALVMYSHHLMGEAINTELTKNNVETYFQKLGEPFQLNHLQKFEYVLIVISGYESVGDFQKWQNDIHVAVARGTKISLVVALAQASISLLRSVTESSIEQFNPSQLIAWLDSLIVNSGPSIKSQAVFIQDLIDFSDKDEIVNPLQFVVQSYSQGEPCYLGGLNQDYYPINSTQVAKLVVRELFVLRLNKQIISIRGNSLTNNRQLKDLLEKKGEQPLCLLPDFKANHEIQGANLVHPPHSILVETYLQKIKKKPPHFQQMYVPKIKELPIDYLPPPQVVVPTKISSQNSESLGHASGGTNG